MPHSRSCRVPPASTTPPAAASISTTTTCPCAASPTSSRRAPSRCPGTSWCPGSSRAASACARRIAEAERHAVYAVYADQENRPAKRRVLLNRMRNGPLILRGVKSPDPRKWDPGTGTAGGSGRGGGCPHAPPPGLLLVDARGARRERRRRDAAAARAALAGLLRLGQRV